MPRYCIFPVHSSCTCGKCKDFTRGWNCKCAKCNDTCAAYIRELKEEYSQYKTLLENWKSNNGGYSATWICSRCWRKDIIEKHERIKEKVKKNNENQHKSSHCHTCNNKSTFFHFIYDKRSGKVWDSWSNAPDPDNQLVFCNQGCFEKYMEKQNAYICSGCGQKGSGNYFYNKTDPERKKFCSNSCWKDYVKKKVDEVNQEEIDALNEKKNDLNRQQLENLQELMKGGHDLDFDFENASWLDEEYKAICRAYQKNREEVKRLKKQQEQLNSGDLSSGNTGDSSSSNENEETCSKCNSNGTLYYNKKTNDGLFCKKCYDDYYHKKNNDSSVNTKKINKCDKCSKEISKSEKSYYADAKNKTGTLCSDCLDKELEEEETKDNNSQKGNSNSPREKLKPIADTLKTGKDLINQGYELHEINTSQLSESQESQLEDYYNERINKLNKINEKPFYKKPWVIIGAVIILLIPLLMVIRNAQVRKKRKLK